MAKESSPHTGHRQRMRARVEQYGLESLEPHEALEYVLYITNTRKDTNGLAHVLSCHLLAERVGVAENIGNTPVLF